MLKRLVNIEKTSKFGYNKKVIQIDFLGFLWVMKKIAVLVSGGVDSSVALALLKQQGHDVTAFYLKIWLEDELSYLGSCPWEQDLAYASGVCEKLNVPLRVVSMQKEYHERVVSYMLQDIKAGRTPNPDMLCNQQIKFGAFYDAIDRCGETFDYIATGHYAQIEHTPTVSILKKGKDPVKDQTYFLAYLSQAQLKRALFPIGGFEKLQVRQLAKQFDLPTQDRKDSQGICFLGKFQFSDFLKAHLGTKMGDLIEFETGKKLAEHEGFWFYTIGQRQGLGLSGGPWYVVSKDAGKNIVYISKTYGAVTQHKSGMIVKNFNWIIPLSFAYNLKSSARPECFAQQNISKDKGACSESSNKSFDLDVRFRHGPAVHPAIVTINGTNVTIMLETESKQGIAAGQFAVLYDGDVCLGGGIIEQAI
ncbi:MAG TPA: tRNA 2-thiouridine(34) synthase MnmA [Candidatus Saccharimonadales bacterium]|nr:tRNA 2-thiouridine(34) synthase MnmA [Candidatus Saccharimonadales bacterium]